MTYLTDAEYPITLILPSGSALTVDQHVGPADWASYFINGDATSFSNASTETQAQAEQDRADAWLASEVPGGRIVDVQGEPFFGRCPVTRRGRDLVVYVSHTHVPKPA